MNPYLEKVRALKLEKGIPLAPTKPTKPPFGSFGGDRGMAFLKNLEVESPPLAGGVDAQDKRKIDPIKPEAVAKDRVQDTHRVFEKGIPRSPTKPTKGLAGALEQLTRHCPEYVDGWRWQQAISDGGRFLGQWGEQAAALGWTSSDLFALHQPPPDPHPSYDRLGRFDCLGLVWVLEGRPVTMLSSGSAKIKTTTGSMTFRRKTTA